MSDKILISQYNGIKEYQHIDPMREGDLIVESVQDCEPIMERAKELSQLTPGVEWRHVGLIPNVIYERAVREGWHLDKARWHRWLNDPDNRAFRTWPGNIGPTRQI
jgi:hypothetical protein